jgi:hypothetical protein
MGSEFLIGVAAGAFVYLLMNLVEHLRAKHCPYKRASQPIGQVGHGFVGNFSTSEEAKRGD